MIAGENVREAVASWNQRALCSALLEGDPGGPIASTQFHQPAPSRILQLLRQLSALSGDPLNSPLPAPEEPPGLIRIHLLSCPCGSGCNIIHLCSSSSEDTTETLSPSFPFLFLGSNVSHSILLLVIFTLVLYSLFMVLYLSTVRQKLNC